mgnify:FL=1
MIVLKADSELKMTFERLIKTMHANVNWTGLFVALDNYLILQGEVRSLFFHFDSRKVAENIVDLPIKEDEIKDTDEAAVRDVINMILYAFGKWGTIQGLRVEKNTEQLNTLFGHVLAGIYIEPEYTTQYFRFYHAGKRITYEDVIQAALEAKEAVQKEEEADEEQGLWHKVEWKMAHTVFERTELSLSERAKGRIGNNFYKVGYRCPKCKGNLHMIMYPKGKEFRIETPEGVVLLAKACTCAACHRFYTPRPWKLLGDGDIYLMDFEEDKKAYEDYLELMGRNGEHEANSRYNEYEDGRKPAGVEDEQQPLEELCEDLPEYSDADFEELLNKIEEGFFPESSIAACEPAIQEEKKRRKKLKSTPASDQDEVTDDEEEQDESKNRHEEKQHGNESAGESGWKRNEREEKQADARRNEEKSLHVNARQSENERREGNISRNENERLYADARQDETERRHVKGSRYESDSRQPHEAGQISGESSDEKYAQVNNAEAQKVRETYQAKFGVADRMSERQLSELKHQLMHETRISPEERKQYLDMLEEKEQDRKLTALNKKAESCADKNYAVMRRVYDEIAEEKLPQEKKQNLLLNLKQKMQTQAEREVTELVGKMPPNMDRARYHALREKLKEYEGVDLTPYQERLESQKNLAEQQEIKNMIRQSRKITRDDLTGLKERLKEKEFEPGLVLPYFEQIENKIRQMDENEIAEITGDPVHMSFEEGMDAYQKIADGPYLPDLKDNALELLSRRLSKIKTDECEQLVNKLKNELKEAGIAENQKHYFYPARKVLLKQATPQETEVIDYAMASYAAGNGLFEYPIFVVDTSRNNSGKEGIILTPEHLYYSTLMTSYRIDVSSVLEISASTGLLNRGVYVTEKNGKKTKIPYAVDNKQLTAYAGVLNEFIHYLQEKPDSRNISYLAKEKHDTICCFRCGYVYKGGNVCPKCGFKNNA